MCVLYSMKLSYYDYTHLPHVLLQQWTLPIAYHALLKKIYIVRTGMTASRAWHGHVAGACVLNDYVALG